MSQKKEHFCPCGDRKCPHNPNNPCNSICSCDACIEKNLSRGEIPSCFFKKINNDISSLTDFTFEAFAKFLEDNKKSGVSN